MECHEKIPLAAKIAASTLVFTVMMALLGIAGLIVVNRANRDPAVPQTSGSCQVLYGLA